MVEGNIITFLCYLYADKGGDDVVGFEGILRVKKYSYTSCICRNFGIVCWKQRKACGAKTGRVATK